MNKLLCALMLLVPLSVRGDELIDWLQRVNPNGYFPMSGEYQALPEVCNETTCFRIVSLYSESTALHGNRRLAIFSSSGEYLGVYSGFDELPIGVSGNQVLFPESEYGKSISFDGEAPPAKAYVDGHLYELDPAP